MDLLNWLVRFRYPVSLPTDVSQAIGIEMPNSVRFCQLLSQITSPTCRPTKLNKFMNREDAEKAFHLAPRKERFCKSSLYSFCFNEGWLEFELQFDDHSRLRRIYIHHKQIPLPQGFELILTPSDATPEHATRYCVVS